MTPEEQEKVVIAQLEEQTDTIWTVSEEGMNIVSDGSPEYLVYCSVPAGAEGITITDLVAVAGDVLGLGLGRCMKNKWLKKQGDIITKAIEDAPDVTAEMLRAVASGDINSVNKKELGLLKKRKLII